MTVCQRIANTRIICELDFNRLKIREVATAAHDAAENSLSAAIAIWSTNMGTAQESLMAVNIIT